MKNIKSFATLFTEIKQKVSPQIASAVELVKKERKTLSIIALIVCLLFDIGMYLWYGSVSKILVPEMLPFFIIFFLIINLLIFVFITTVFGKNKRNFVVFYKNLVIKKLIDNFYSEVSYYPNKGISRNIYNEGDYQEYYNRYYSDDYFNANAQPSNVIDIAEVKTVHHTTRRSSNGHTSSSNVTKFYGVFSRVRLTKPINSSLRITANGRFSSNSDKLKMDSGEFEKYFDVFASNKIIGMQLLTADVMEDLLNFKNKHKMTFDIFINDNNMYLRFHCGRIFEPVSLKNDGLDKTSLEKYYNILSFINSLTEKMITLINEAEI